MASIAAVLADAGSKGQGTALREQLSAFPFIQTIAVKPELRSAATVVEVLRWFEKAGSSHLLWVLSPRVELAESGLQRLAQVADDSRAAIVYSDYFDRQVDGGVKLHPLIDYQPGSVRDDFDFGQVVLLSHQAVMGVADAIEQERTAGKFSGWYNLRLRASEHGPFVHLAEPAYVVRAADEAKAGEAHFDYVNPRNRDYQVEMEQVATAHLRRIGAWLPTPSGKPVEDNALFAVEASVVIPVRNRVRTVVDAVRSALSQRADFAFNVIVVDNHSTDGTTDALAELAKTEKRLVHLVPGRTDLGIGGCWNEAVFSQQCGGYAVQLDSDDLYASPDVLSRVIGEFKRGGYAIVIGSYTIVDVELKQIPPGLIDHREWTAENGHNNALRIAGLGAPRAFHVPTLRKIGFPNVSFGEDYAVALRISREYPIGRIYDSLYWCRRWEGNSDHALPLETQNRYAFYKDRLRSIEIAARQQCSRP